MLEQDGRDPEEAAELIRFAVEDSDHWQIVLASEANPMAKFRGAYNAIASSGGAVYA